MSRGHVVGLLAAAAVVAAPVAASAAPREHRPVPVAKGTGGAAATVDRAGTNAAIRVLRRGGNAVDATIAAAGVLGVVEPYSCGIGGGGFMVIRTPEGRVTTIDSRETAPAAMQPDSFIENGAPLAFLSARYSGLSAGVPGTVRGWDLALRRYGTRPLAELLQPAIGAAREGFVVDQVFVDQTATTNPVYFDDLPATRDLFLDPDGTPRDVGTVLRNPDLAKTLERIARRGADGFYRGPIARAITRAVQAPPVGAGADQTWRPGLMTQADIRRYRAIERRPTRIDYRGFDVFSMGPPSSGGTTVGEVLNILEQVDGYQDLSEPEKLHYLLEAERYAYADRAAYLGDPAYTRVPVQTLLSDAFAASRRAAITPAAANAVVPAATIPATGAARAAISRPTQSTTHLTVADGDGMVVSYTFTIESTGGNGIVVPGWGFLLNNELTDFGFDVPTGPNRVEGGKRPRSSIAPTYIERQGRPFLALGSPGGASIIGTVLNVITQRLDFGRGLPAAIAFPRASQRNGPTTEPEQGFLDEFGPALTAPPFGHAFGTPSAALGAVTAIELRRRMTAAAEPVRRGGGNAQVVSARRTARR